MTAAADRLEQSDTARAIIPTLEAEIAATERAMDYYRNLDRNMGGAYAAGSYVLTDGDGNFITRGPNGQQMMLAPAAEGLKTVRSWVTMKEADKAAAQFGRWFPEEPAVRWMGHRAAVESHLRKLKARLAQAQDTARQDPWFDGSGSAQDFDANSGL